MPSERMYRYQIAAARGDGKRIEEPYIIEDRYCGEAASWLLFDGSVTAFFVDSGFIHNDQYEPDSDYAILSAMMEESLT